jgi:Glycosyl hydrolase family 26
MRRCRTFLFSLLLCATVVATPLTEAHGQSVPSTDEDTVSTNPGVPDAGELHDSSLDARFGDVTAPEPTIPDTPPPVDHTAPVDLTRLTRWDGDPYWGAYLSGAPYTTSVMDAFENRTAKRLSVLHFGQAWSTSGTFHAFPTAAMNAVRSRGTIPYLTWGGWGSTSAGATQVDWQNADIAGGRYDSYITAWAQAAKAWGHPFFLRFDWEMNGNWYPWSERANGNAPGSYITMWRHVHDIFAAQGATNATWVWCPNISGGTSTPYSKLYPGDAYVDWTCMDGYNYAGLRSAPWQTPTQVFMGGSVSAGHNSYQELLDVAPSKPIMIGETASTESGGSKSDWIQDLLLVTLPQKMPAVKAIVWTDWNGGNTTRDWPIESSVGATAAFAKGIASPYWEPNSFGSIDAINTLLAGVSQPAQPTTVSAQLAGTTTLSPIADSQVSQASPDTNFGTSSQLQANDNVNLSYLRFDLRTLAGHTITSAQLSLHTRTESWAGSAATFTVATTSGGWSETGITWSNKPVIGSMLGTIKQPGVVDQWYTISLDLAGMQAAVSGGELDIVLHGDSTKDSWSFSSRESGTLSPQLALAFQ